jgi:hypothetical protein
MARNIHVFRNPEGCGTKGRKDHKETALLTPKQIRLRDLRGLLRKIILPPPSTSFGRIPKQCCASADSRSAALMRAVLYYGVPRVETWASIIIVPLQIEAFPVAKNGLAFLKR